MQAFKCSFMFDGAFIRDYSAERRNTRKAKQMDNVTNKNREHWLNSACRFIVRELESLGYSVPRYRVTASFAAGGGASLKAIGQCIYPEASEDNTTEILVSLTQAEPLEVAAVLCHELIHAALPGAGHGPHFRRAALAMGLTGKMTATVAGDEFKEMIAPLLAELGEYPHAACDVSSQRKKQTTRMVKCVCECGYTVRTTSKWIAVGVPHCPHHGAMTVV